MSSGYTYDPRSLNPILAGLAAEGQTVVSRVRVPDPPLGAPDPGSEAVLLTVDQPFGKSKGSAVKKA